MKTFSHLWQYRAEFFLEWEMFRIKVVEKIKIHILCPIIFFPENEIVPKSMVAPEKPQMTIRRGVDCWISKDTPTQTHAVPRQEST